MSWHTHAPAPVNTTATVWLGSTGFVAQSTSGGVVVVVVVVVGRPLSEHSAAATIALVKSNMAPEGNHRAPDL
jgi:hypothetical protein